MKAPKILLEHMNNILSHNASDRRQMFEEAAGINHYKQQRQAALKKMDSRKYNPTNLKYRKIEKISDNYKSWKPENDFYNQKVLIIGPGKSVKRNKKKIVKFVIKKKLLVISVNLNRNFNENYINYRIACHPKRILSDYIYYKKFRLTLDYIEDYYVIWKIYNKLYPLKKLFELKDIIKYLKHNVHLLVNKKYLNVNWYRHHLTELKTIKKKDTTIKFLD